MTAGSVSPRHLFSFLLLLAVAGRGCCQALLDPEPRTCRNKDNAVAASAADAAPTTYAVAAAPSEGRRKEYPAGGVLMVLFQVTAGLFGSLHVYLCPDGEEVECLDRVPLQLADGSGTSFDLHKIPGTDNYEIPFILPDNITCPTCTLQVSVLSRDCEDEAACPVREKTTCAELTIREIKEFGKRGIRKRGHRKSRRRSSTRRGSKGSRRRSSQKRRSRWSSRKRGRKQSKRPRTNSWSEYFPDIMSGIDSLASANADTGSFIHTAKLPSYWSGEPAMYDQVNGIPEMN